MNASRHVIRDVPKKVLLNKLQAIRTVDWRMHPISSCMVTKFDVRNVTTTRMATSLEQSVLRAKTFERSTSASDYTGAVGRMDTPFCNLETWCKRNNKVDS